MSNAWWYFDTKQSDHLKHPAQTSLKKLNKASQNSTVFKDLFLHRTFPPFTNLGIVVVGDKALSFSKRDLRSELEAFYRGRWQLSPRFRPHASSNCWRQSSSCHKTPRAKTFPGTGLLLRAFQHRVQLPPAR